MSMTESEAMAELKTFPVNCLDFMENQALDVAISALEEVQELHAIGTVSEFRELKEKATAKKPKDIVGLKGSPNTLGKCPCCNGITDDTYCYCDDCGQKLDWSEGKE